MSGNKIENLVHNETISFIILQLARKMNYIAKEIMERELSDFKVDEFAVLHIVYSNPGICQKDLAELCVIEKGRICKTIALLEEKKFIKRLPGVKNKKLIYKLEITAKGKKSVVENGNHIMAMKQMVYDTFSSEEEENLRQNLKRLLNSMENFVSEKLKEKKCQTK